jgi:hypothetical protein
MKKLVCAVTILILSGGALSQDLATCKASAGYSYYVQRGLVDAKRAGWTTDQISNGVMTLKKLGKSDYDIMYLDATDKIHSIKSEGGSLQLLRSSEHEMTFILSFPGGALAIYTFLKDNAGRNQVAVLTSRGSDGIFEFKQSAMVADCTAITFVQP